MWGDIAIAFTIAFVTAFMATPYTIRFAKDPRRINHITMPRLRRFSCNFGIFRISYIFTYCNDY